MDKRIVEELKKLNKKIDVILIIQLTERGLKLKDISNILDVSKRTIQNIISVRKIKISGKNDKEKK